MLRDGLDPGSQDTICVPARERSGCVDADPTLPLAGVPFFSVWANFTSCSCEALLDLRAVIRQVKRGAGFRPGLHLPERARQFSLYYFRKVEPVLRLVIFCLHRPTGYLPALPLVTLRGILPDGR